MARYRRRSNHWMWQPRDSRGRFGFGSGGGIGSNKPDPMNEWFLKAPWWKKILALVAMAAVLVVIFETGLLIPLAIIGLIIAFAGK